MKIDENRIKTDFICWLFVIVLICKAIGYDEFIIFSIILSTVVIVLTIRIGKIVLPAYAGMYAWTFSMLLSTVVGIMTGTSEWKGLIYDSTLLMCIILGFFIAYKLEMQRYEKMQLYVFIGGILFGIVEMILERNPMRNLFYVDTLLHTSRICSIYVHPVIAAVYFLVSFWMIVYDEQINYYIKICLVILDLIVLVKTGSRSSWLALCLTLILWLLDFNKKKISLKTIKRIILIVSLLVLWKFSNIGNYFSGLIFSRLINIGSSIAALQRLKSWKYIISSYCMDSDIWQLLFGYGYRASQSKMLEITIIQRNFFAVDNTYVANLYNYGIVNIIFTVCFFIMVIKSFLTSNDNRIKKVSIIIISIMIAGLFFECNYFINTSFLLYTYVGSYIGLKMKGRMNE